MFEVNFLAVAIAGVANMVLGFIWYAPKVFGDTWIRSMNLTPDQMEAGKKKMPMMAIAGFIAALIMAYVLNHFAIAWGVVDWIGAVELGFWTWLGFVAVVLLGTVLWEGKSIKMYAINAGYWLIALIMMALVLFWMS